MNTRELKNIAKAAKARTFAERTAQLGRIALLELELTKRNNPRSTKPQPQPRTNKAKRILWQYEINVFGVRSCDLEFGYEGEQKRIYENVRFTSEQFQGINK